MEPEKHPFAAMTAGQRYYFTVKLQSNMAELTEYDDDLFQECIIKMLENSRSREEMTEAITDFIGGEKTEKLVQWMWDTMNVYLTDERYSMLQPPSNPWNDIPSALHLPFVQYCHKKENLSFEAALERLKFTVMKAARGPFAKQFPRPNTEEYLPLQFIKQFVCWLKYINFDTADETNVFITDPDFKEFFLDSLYIMGFLINTTTEMMNREYDEIRDNREEDDSDEDMAPFNAEPMVLPLADHATELIVLTCKGIANLRSKEQAANGEEDLYQKYKSMSTAATETASITDITDEIIGRMTPAMAEIFSVSSIARKLLQSNAEISCVDFVAKSSVPQVRMLYQLVNALDTELIVLHGAEKKGFVVDVSGCSDGKLFSLALAANLIQSEKNEPHLLAGNRPAKMYQDFLDAMGDQILEEPWPNPFSISNWTCVKPDGSVPTGMAGASHWTYLEGSVKEFPLWNGKRVIILGKAPFAKKFEPIRVFDKLQAKVTIKKSMGEQEVTALLQEIGKTEDNVRSEAIEYYKQWKPSAK